MFMPAPEDTFLKQLLRIRSLLVRRIWLIFFSLFVVTSLLGIAWLAYLLLKVQPERVVYLVEENQAATLKFEVAALLDHTALELNQDNEATLKDINNRDIPFLKYILAERGLCYFYRGNKNKVNWIAFIGLKRPQERFMKRLQKDLETSDFLEPMNEAEPSDTSGGPYYQLTDTLLIISSTASLPQYSEEEITLNLEGNLQYKTQELYFPDALKRRIEESIREKVQIPMTEWNEEVSIVWSNYGDPLSVNYTASDSPVSINYIHPFLDEPKNKEKEL